jgi:hypothetical protein
MTQAQLDESLSFEPTDLPASQYPRYQRLLGAANAGITLVREIVFSDVIDEDELRTGARREGAYFGVNAFVTRFAIALEAASIGSIFMLSGYDPTLGVQPASFLLGLRFLVSMLPMFGMILAFVLMVYYPWRGIIWKASKQRRKSCTKKGGAKSSSPCFFTFRKSIIILGSCRI